MDDLPDCDELKDMIKWFRKTFDDLTNCDKVEDMIIQHVKAMDIDELTDCGKGDHTTRRGGGRLYAPNELIA